MTFAQRGSVSGTDGITHDGITCYNCQLVGHYATQCPTTDAATQHTTATGATLVQYAFMMTQANAGPGCMDPNWILLDS